MSSQKYCHQCREPYIRDEDTGTHRDTHIGFCCEECHKAWARNVIRDMETCLGEWIGE